MEEATLCYGLPDPIWDDILLAVGIQECYLRPISTMSKQLYSLTNRLKKSLNITTNNKHCLSSLLKRFPNLKHINLPFFIDPTEFFGEISKFGISLESLDLSLMRTFPIKRLKELPISTLSATLRSLKLSYVEDQADVDGDLDIIAELFPNLEELELFWKYEVTNNGVANLSSKLKRLKKISLIGNFLVTDLAIDSLVRNCLNLEDIALNRCMSITYQGIYFIFRHCKNLKSFALKEMNDIGNGGPLALARNLSSLEFTSMVVSDDLLCAIGRANIPLKSLSLTNCKRFTLQGILPLLGAYHSVLEYFAIENPQQKLKPGALNYIALYLLNVKTVKLNYCCHQLSTGQILGFVHKCRCLETLELKGSDISDYQEPFMLYSGIKSHLKSLNLSLCKDLTDQILATVSRACPKLSHIFLNLCKKITHRGFIQMIRNCVGLRTVEINGCDEVLTLGLDATVSYKLEVLEARGSCIDDDDMNLMAMKCPDLRYLNVCDCRYVTASGIGEVAAKCKNLGKLRVSLENVDADTEFWIRSKRPGLFDRLV
ncbi:hypothetical protein V2J09_005335 [Rumex salicifolius]